MRPRPFLLLIAGFALALMAAGEADAEPDDMVGHWSFDEGEGTTAYDSSGNGNNGTLVNGPQWVNGIRGSALQFDGENDYVYTNYLQNGVSMYTISAWINITSSSTGNNVIIQNRGTGGGHSLTLGVGHDSTGRLYYFDDSNGIIIGRDYSGGLNDDTWHHIVGVYDGGGAVRPSQFTIYLDGNSVSTGTRSQSSDTAPLTGLSGTRIGHHEKWNTYFSGSIDDVIIWDRALSPEEIGQLYESYSSPAIIDSIKPNPVKQNYQVTFSGHGEPGGETFIRYAWRSSINGKLHNGTEANFMMAASQLTQGDHTIYFRVQNENGNWSAEASRTLTVLPPDSDGDGVGDNGDAFPSDPSASVDSDGDGFPDVWNLGKSQTNSITGLHLDLFPSDPAASVDSDGDGFPDGWNPGKSQTDSTTDLHLDLFPSDPEEWADADGDGVGDNGDAFPRWPRLHASWQGWLILVTLGIATYSASFSFLTKRAFHGTEQALGEWESAGVNTSPARELLAEGHQMWKRFIHPAAMVLAWKARKKGEEHAWRHGNVKRTFNHIEKKLQGYEAEGVQVGPARDILEQARSVWDEMDFQKAEELARQAGTEGEELESQYQAAAERVTELKAKIEEFKEKGINTDELERVLAECEAEMGAVTESEE